MGKAVRDVVLTREEVGGLMAELLCTGADPEGKTKLTSWAGENAGFLGKRYQSELSLRFS
jgi:predicted oxidoreductase